MSISPGSRFGTYEILAPLGAGGMGEVYRARDSRLGREVAIKVLPEEFFEDGDRVARFEREEKTLGALNHAGIAGVHAFEEIAGRHLLVMELVDGEDLTERLVSGPIPLDESLSLAKQIAESLEAAHEKGIVHRDLKPANVKITADGRVKLLDFGLAKLRSDDARADDRNGKPGESAPSLVFGTPGYMAPEQRENRHVDQRADIF